jgi:hypothetical protein
MSLNTTQTTLASTASESIGSDIHNANFYPSPSITSLSDGTGADKAQKAASLVVPTTTNATNLDLTALLGGINAVAINFSKIKEVHIQNQDLTNSVTIGGGSNPATNVVPGAMTLGPGATFSRIEHTSGMIVDGTHKIIPVTAVAGTPNVLVVAVGEGT